MIHGYKCVQQLTRHNNKHNPKQSSSNMKSQEARSSPSCAACKFLKRRCATNCQFAPYFRSNEHQKFAKVHKVFGASNVNKILNEVAENQRDDTVNSLVYEAEVRLRDPVHGCIGAMVSLQHKMAELQHDLSLARARLATVVSHHPSLFLDIHGCYNNMVSVFEVPESNNSMIHNLNHNSQIFGQFDHGSHFP